MTAGVQIQHKPDTDKSYLACVVSTLAIQISKSSEIGYYRFKWQNIDNQRFKYNISFIYFHRISTCFIKHGEIDGEIEKKTGKLLWG